MLAAIYSRKSKFTGKGESLENQIQLCKEYAMKNLNLSENDFIIYEDEGYSGKNTKRPQFQKLLKDAKSGKINIIICYRLDRISRNISDFANLIEALNRDNIGFISIKEQFDTTTPMGRAMMYIASVFSQLERETIAERIKDNMLQLAKTGRWLGGVPPTGYKSEPVIYKDSNGKGKKQYRLTTVKDEADLVRLIYSKYVSLKSITQVQSYLAENQIKTKNGRDFSRYSIRLILSNPVYASADKELYRYFIKNKYNVCSDIEEFDGFHGLMSYNKTDQCSKGKSNRYKDSTQWIIAVGQHEGIIPGHVWMKAQKLLDINTTKSYRKAKSTKALLSGILRCANCGSFMRPKTVQRKNDNGEQIFYYICELKEKSRRSRCLMPNINGNTLDKLILDEIYNFMINNPPIFDYICINKRSNISMTEIYSLRKLENVAETICNPEYFLYNLMDIQKKRIIINAIVDKILWNGKKLVIILIGSDLFPQCEDSK